jgi:hypothetical protein
MVERLVNHEQQNVAQGGAMRSGTLYDDTHVHFDDWTIALGVVVEGH